MDKFLSSTILAYFIAHNCAIKMNTFEALYERYPVLPSQVAINLE